MQTQLFGVSNSAYVNRSADRASQDLAKVARLEAKLIKTQKELAALERVHAAAIQSNEELLSRLSSQGQTIMELTGMIRQLQAQKTESGKGSIPSEMWRRLVQLCHPDKHSNSESATLATQWLNQVRP